MVHELLDLAKWTDYIKKLTKEFNALPEVPPILSSIEPTLFQYNLNDHPELNFWHAFDKNGIKGGMGENTEDKDFIRLVHKADFEVIRKVFSGKLNPVQATMDGIYIVDGDMAKLMACAPLLPLQVKAHEKVI
ncbi:MAG: SCP2 sterol-binding domain-containing protein [Candidatus Thorarchaeota archaeon]